MTSIYPYFGLTFWFLCVGASLLRPGGFFDRLVSSEQAQTRFHSLDGLRGFLALGVFIHHGAVSIGLFTTGRWERPASDFYNLLGQVGVSFFFMITAFLFWTKGTKGQMRLQIKRFFWFRVMRLGPMLLFSAVFAVIVALLISDVSLFQLLSQLAHQTFGRIVYWIPDTGNIVTVPRHKPMVSVYWTLRYELLFYLCLPLALLFVRYFGLMSFLVVVTGATIAFSRKQVEWDFIAGLTTAALIPLCRRAPVRAWNHWAVSVGVLVVLGFIFARGGSAYEFQPAFLLFICFMCLANGNSIFGLLTTRPARVLGTISYSIYMVHCILLVGFLYLIDRLAPIRLMSPSTFWLIIGALGTGLILLSAITFRYVEYPAMRLPSPAWTGKRIRA